MDIRQNPLLMGFWLGRWWDTSVRVSLYFPLLAVALCAQLGWRLGLAATLVLFFSILFHEFCHVIAARKTGGSGDEILIWPLGGLAWVQPAASFTSRFWTPTMGPISNFALFLATLPAVLYHGAPAGTFHVVYLPDLQFTSQTMAFDFLVLICSLNLKLTILNLLPIHPLDGSQMASEVASRYWPPEVARQGVLWAGMLLCIIMTAAGGMLHAPEHARDMLPVIFTGFLLMVMCMHEFITNSYRRALGQWSLEQEESFLGYDFSRGYAAFEEDEVSPFEKRQQEIAVQRKLQEEREREQIRQRVDELLDKVHQQGLDSLTEAERRFLTQASKKYPSRG